ncbi:hypothetical protein D3C76_1217810 [compost metagenome]
MAVEVSVGLRLQRLQQAAVGEVHQVALGARTTGDEERHRFAGVFDYVMAALGDAGGEYLAAVQAIAHGVVMAVGIVAGGEQQGRAIAPAAEGPAAQADGAEQQAGEGEDLATEHLSHRRWR